MDDTLLERGPSDHGATSGRQRVRPLERLELARNAMEDLSAVQAIRALEEGECALCLAQSCRLPHHGLEDGSDVERGAADDREHLVRGGLLLESGLALGEQPRVLHRDRELVGERLDERDGRLVESTGIGPGHRQHPDRFTVPDDRHRHPGPALLGLRNLRLRERRVGVVEALPTQRRPAPDRARLRAHAIALLARAVAVRRREQPTVRVTTEQPRGL